jgi:hypothetical protein
LLTQPRRRRLRRNATRFVTINTIAKSFEFDGWSRGPRGPSQHSAARFAAVLGTRAPRFGAVNFADFL